MFLISFSTVLKLLSRTLTHLYFSYSNARTKWILKIFPVLYETTNSPEHAYSIIFLYVLNIIHRIYHIDIYSYILRGLLAPGPFSEVAKIAWFCIGDAEKRVTFGYICVGYYTAVMAHICSDDSPFLGSWHHSLGVGKYQHIFSYKQNARKIMIIMIRNITVATTKNWKGINRIAVIVEQNYGYYITLLMLVPKIKMPLFLRLSWFDMHKVYLSACILKNHQGLEKVVNVLFIK